MSQKQDKKIFVRTKNSSTLVLVSLFSLSVFLGFFVFFKYEKSQREITSALTLTQTQAPNLTIEQCAQKNMEWFLSCHSMSQVCMDTVSRMIKICLVNGEKANQCDKFGNEIYGYNFGASQCAPYLSKKDLKRACADTWQSVADYCKAQKKAQVATKKQLDKNGASKD